jgi:NAD(P)-dependent dehydrogenase (short-subunit alcohol dehydrogenase family)
MDTTGDSRVWMITGASSGLGRVLAEEALGRGDRVIATARDPQQLADLLERFPDTAIAARLDVTETNEAHAAANAGITAFHRIDVVVNNAGYGLFGALEDLSDDELRREFDTNVFGGLNVIRAVLPQLRRQRSGHLVQISSLEGIAPALAGETAYAATKFAMEGLVEGLAKEVAHLGIGVTIVEPGPLRTDFANGATVRTPQSDDYDESVGRAIEWFADIAGEQPNDPRKVAAAIIEAVSHAEPPLRLALGEETVQAVRTKLDAQRQELDAWHSLSTSTAVTA